MLTAHRTGDERSIAGAASIVVIADFLFTAMVGLFAVMLWKPVW